MKLIFLDIDGVLNRERRMPTVCKVEQDCLTLLRGLTERSEAQIVLSSAWRLKDEAAIRKVLSPLPVLGITPRRNGNNRAREIRAFLDGLQEPVEAFVLLDDRRTRWGDLMPYLVGINRSRGLTVSDVARAETLLRSHRLFDAIGKGEPYE